ncbi:ATP-binding cassette domain-containing protein [Solemya velum gill symbiont]|uniref:Probable ATP-binding protein YheS n=2 Tax=Solemya velum gill symbiont TaxID=2340 RepID=A0A1T2K8W4_SOVGS|nr:ATP-binding cassette domain-containing protein [Solemya velum gill symbiont]OOY36220.1 ABC transporter ATP-binding protein [Solemya velum gill symbiont]OOY47956.1 ABC transporter ATP-binding protein [Solemya velum gill symbiont]OOY50897.1 ABC transporter ATP-binding protein [Solemya velum gill symbiont]OOY53952.1 ABC transporter ATP-binding protein [Solemya velum gill symbiont]OOY57753.1 ABC transporter ATP-binding protein [Solemya velum gill symbiont]
MISFDDVALRRGTRLLFEGASFRIHPGQKVALTGRNGTGKSSLFSMLLRELETDNGTLQLPDSWVIAHVAQQTPDSDRSALDFTLDGDTELRELQNAIEQEKDGHRHAELLARYEVIDGYCAESRAAQLLNGLGFSPEQVMQPVNSFSGGWRMRLNLAQALMCRSDLLLLDEPTNHLDLDAVIWLEQYLRDYQGTLLLISHDRDFLDQVATHVLHIEQQGVVLYKGNYSTFEVTRSERLAQQQAAHEKQQAEIKHMRQFVERFRAKATKAKQAQSRLKALERMTLISSAHVDSPFHFSFAEPEKQPNPLLRLEQCSAGYGDKEILTTINLEIQQQQRIGLLGPNGAGKSTLIKLIAGTLAQTRGKRTLAQDCKIGYFAQHQLEQLHPQHSPFDHLRQLDAAISDQRARDFLGGFGFNGDRVYEKVAPFSGGEKARLALALIVYQKPNLLLLDEPTNHLDIEMRHALAQALQEFKGAMLIVSHDRFLMRATCDQLLLVDAGSVAPFDDDLDHYPAWIAARLQEQSAPESNRSNASQAQDRKDKKRKEAEQRKRLAPLKKLISQLEKQLDDLNRQKSAIEEQMAEPGIYDEENKERLKQLIADNSSIEQQIATAEESWMEKLEELEAETASQSA